MNDFRAMADYWLKRGLSVRVANALVNADTNYVSK